MEVSATTKTRAPRTNRTGFCAGASVNWSDQAANRRSARSSPQNSSPSQHVLGSFPRDTSLSNLQRLPSSRSDTGPPPGERACGDLGRGKCEARKEASRSHWRNLCPAPRSPTLFVLARATRPQPLLSLGCSCSLPWSPICQHQSKGGKNWETR